MNTFVKYNGLFAITKCFYINIIFVSAISTVLNYHCNYLTDILKSQRSCFVYTMSCWNSLSINNDFSHRVALITRFLSLFWIFMILLILQTVVLDKRLLLVSDDLISVIVMRWYEPIVIMLHCKKITVILRTA